MMRWRGWKASAPLGAHGLSGSPRGLGLALGAFISTKGKSVIGPDQVSSVFSNAEKRVGAEGRRGDGMTIKTTCHRAAATRARRGRRRSTQHSLTTLPSRKFVGTGVQGRAAARAAKMTRGNEPQA